MSTLILRKVTNGLFFATLAGVLFGLGFASPLNAQDLDEVLEHVYAETSVVVRIDSTTLDALIERVKLGGQQAKQPQQLAIQNALRQRLEKSREILDGKPVWMTVGMPRRTVQVIIHDPNEQRIEMLKELWGVPEPQSYRFEPPVTFVRSSNPDLQRNQDAERMEQWKKILSPPAGLGDTPTDKTEVQNIRFGVLPPAHLYDVYRELLTDLPKNLGGGPVTLLTEGLQSVSGTFDIKTGALDGTIVSASPDAAKAFAERVTELVKPFAQLHFVNSLLAGHTPEGENAEFNRIVGSLIHHLDSSHFEAVESHIDWQIPANEHWLPEKMLAAAFGETRIGLGAISLNNRLRQLALGVLNYESAHGFLPPPADSRGPEGPTGLSWRVHILPFIEQGALYNKFALDEPWDSPTNIRLLPEMPDVFSPSGSILLDKQNDAKPGFTTIVAPISDKTILGAEGKVTLASITDGTSNTILLVVVKDELSVPWTAPRGYDFDPENPGAGLKLFNGKALAVLCDGSGQYLTEDNDWLKLFEMNDGEVVQMK